MKKISITLILFLLLAGVSLAQDNVHWATKVVKVSSEYSKDKNSAVEILGYPNVDPAGKKSPYAWAVEPNEIDKELVESAYIIVEFDKAYDATQIAIFQNYNPGAIAAVFTSSYHGDSWEAVYVDSSVIRRSVLPDEPSLKKDSALAAQAGTKHHSLNPLKRDSAFLAKENYDVLYINFPQKRIFQVKIVLHPFAVNGWNQIDAVAISNSDKPIKYPKPVLADQSLILEKHANKMEGYINNELYQLAPVMYPDGKRIYYSENFYYHKVSAFTQDIKYSSRTKIKKYPCKKNKTYPKGYYREATIWTTPKNVPWKLNPEYPKSVAGFSANGDKMYLTYYKWNDDSTLFSTTGLAVSALDTTKWERKDPQDIEFIDSLQATKIKFAYVNGDMLITVYYDSLQNKHVAYIAYKMRKSWSENYKMGPIDEHHFYLPQSYGDLWISIDSIAPDSLGVYSLLWGEPQELEIEGFENYSNYVNFTVPIEDSVMFLAIATKADNVAEYDSIYRRNLYVSFYDKQRKVWKTPIPLNGVNSLADEGAPFLDGDMQTLYFVSNGHKGYGGYDVYMSKKEGDSWLDWSEPLNLGDRINTPGDEDNFVIDQKTRIAYFTSNGDLENCSEQSDIYYIQMAKPVTIHLVGTTRSCKNHRPVGNVTVSLEDLVGNQLYGQKAITFKSNCQGKFDVKITRLIDANKLGKFAYKARLHDYKQCDRRRGKVDYIEVDLTGAPMEIEIKKDLFLDVSIAGSQIVEEEEEDMYVPETDLDVMPEDSIKTEEPQPQPEPQHWAIIPIFDTIGCPTVYHRGQLYAITYDPLDPQAPSQAVRVPVSYQKYFMYNKSDVSLNEEEFKKLTRHVMSLLDKYKSVNVYIVASASKVPTSSYCSNFELARKRAETPEKRLIQYLQKNGIDTSRIYFDKRYIVQGEEYDGDPQNVEKYKRYQFVKIWLYSCSDLIEGKKEEEK